MTISTSLLVNISENIMAEPHQVSISSVDATIAAHEKEGSHDAHLIALAVQIRHNLQYQHRWTKLTLHTVSPLDGKALPRPIISGLPPRKVYVHPDEQVEMLLQDAKQSKETNSEAQRPKQGNESGNSAPAPELEWVLPTHIREEWSLSRFSGVFSKISEVPPDEDQSAPAVQSKWRRTKRLLLAILSDDSSIVYYIVHDGIVKPRQN
jgi:tRNA-splicing endonuclease subunit Sen15, fungi type